MYAFSGKHNQVKNIAVLFNCTMLARVENPVTMQS